MLRRYRGFPSNGHLSMTQRGQVDFSVTLVRTESKGLERELGKMRGYWMLFTEYK